MRARESAALYEVFAQRKEKKKKRKKENNIIADYSFPGLVI